MYTYIHGFEAPPREAQSNTVILHAGPIFLNPISYIAYLLASNHDLSDLDFSSSVRLSQLASWSDLTPRLSPSPSFAMWQLAA